jgi:hypothetical protein
MEEEKRRNYKKETVEQRKLFWTKIELKVINIDVNTSYCFYVKHLQQAAKIYKLKF